MDLLSLKWSNHMSSIYKSLALLRAQDAYSDVSLVCNGQFYDVNKLVLSSCSDYFKDIFSRATAKNLVIVLNDISNSHLELLLDYMYIGELNVKQTELSELMKAAENLRIKGLAVPDEPIHEPKHSNTSKRTAESSPIPKQKKRKSIRPSEKPAISKAEQHDDSRYSETEDIKHIAPKDIASSSCKDEIFIKEEYEDADCSILSDNDTHNTTNPFEDPSTFASADFSANDGYQYNETESQDVSLSDSQIGGVDMAESRQNFSGLDFPSSSVSNSQRVTSHQPNLLPQHSCSFCGKEFPARSLCQRHEGIHTGEKPFQCSFCPHKARQKEHILSHIASKHAMMSPLKVVLSMDSQP